VSPLTSNHPAAELEPAGALEDVNHGRWKTSTIQPSGIAAGQSVG
jgi:hypothetical protein